MKSFNDITHELKEISPLLLQVKENEKQLDIPENYFAALEENVWTQIREDEGVLSALSKSDILIPETYFTSFGDKVMARIKDEAEETANVIPVSSTKTVSIFATIRKLSIAACVVGIMGLGAYKLLHKPEKELVCIDGIACLTQEEILQYMQVHSHEFEMEDVQQAVSNTIVQDTSKDNTKVNSKEEEAIEEYIQSDSYSFDDLESSSTDIF